MLTVRCRPREVGSPSPADHRRDHIRAFGCRHQRCGVEVQTSRFSWVKPAMDSRCMRPPRPWSEKSWHSRPFVHERSYHLIHFTMHSRDRLRGAVDSESFAEQASAWIYIKCAGKQGIRLRLININRAGANLSRLRKTHSQGLRTGEGNDDPTGQSAVAYV